MSEQFLTSPRRRSFSGTAVEMLLVEQISAGTSGGPGGPGPRE